MKMMRAYARRGNVFELERWCSRDISRDPETGIPIWDSSVLAAAASRGHLEIIKWLLAKGCPQDETVCRAAEQSGQWVILKYLVDSGCPRGIKE